ncbi:MAG: hypothetical protein HY314_00915 [Acidobacteria bacterium]|nr:hypothetical protein [Acidobacteriota bacterium]
MDKVEYEEYANALELHVPYSPETLLAEEGEKLALFKRAFVETREGAYAYVTRRHVKRLPVPQAGVPVPVEGIQEKTLNEGWEPEDIEG